ncbi:glycosyltransferase [Paraburkholderia flagellata]|uniref:glycosyltransferase n=1 Tax=Paraburkholderia flagellata TaxID=2883241 RepID=UPI001F24A2E3|nr:glycosyltransferase [Paraburkholderia flagellata]
MSKADSAHENLAPLAFNRGASADPASLHMVAKLVGVFDEAWYCEAYPDVVAAGLDPYAHYMGSGWREGRQPAKWFDVEGYAARFPGFRPAEDNPVLHFFEHGLTDPQFHKQLGMDLWGGSQDDQPSQISKALQNGLCITGYLRSEIGLGQAARNLTYACDTARLPISMRNLPLPGRQNDLEFRSKCNSPVDRKANLVLVGLPAVVDMQAEVAPGRLNVFYPFWELERIPKEWHAAIRNFDEVWLPSSFVARGFAEIPGLVVRDVPQPVRLPREVPPSRGGSTLRFLTYMDTDSWVSRKNPKAAVEAFCAAFALNRRDVELTVKLRGDRGDGLRQWLGEVAAKDDRIHVVDRTLNRAEMDALMVENDVFISLHRSEGFGFGAAEALAAGRAVVSTDYSATTDFIDEQTGFPVACSMVPVGPGEYIRTENQVWAEVNLDAAVAALRAIEANPAEARARAMRGFAVLQDRFSPAVVGKEIGRILGEHGLI